MAALKQAAIAREHVGPHLDMAMFYMDMRTPRKDFEKYMVRIKDQGARLIRSRVHSIHEDEHTKDLVVHYVTETGESKAEIFDMVVLSVGGVMAPDTIELAKKLKIRLSHNRFMDTEAFQPVTTSRAGIFSCGFFNGPKDIPQTVMEGSAAANAATRDLAAAKGTLTRQKDFPPEKVVTEEPARLGIFVCHCGMNIGGLADIPAIVEYAKDIPNVSTSRPTCFPAPRTPRPRWWK
jgi:heterodisulfide reductase subunit A